MKISRLYIGDVRKIVDVKKEADKPTVYKAKLVHKTIFLKSHDNSKKVKDILYGGTYRIGNEKANRKGKRYATDLNQYYLLKTILMSGYRRKNIGVIKLTKVMKNNEDIWR